MSREIGDLSSSFFRPYCDVLEGARVKPDLIEKRDTQMARALAASCLFLAADLFWIRPPSLNLLGTSVGITQRGQVYTLLAILVLYQVFALLRANLRAGWTVATKVGSSLAARLVQIVDLVLLAFISIAGVLSLIQVLEFLPHFWSAAPGACTLRARVGWHCP